MRPPKGRKRGISKETRERAWSQGEVKFTKKQFLNAAFLSFFGMISLFFLLSAIFDNFFIRTIGTVIISIIIMEVFSDTIKYRILHLPVSEEAKYQRPRNQTDLE